MTVHRQGRPRHRPAQRGNTLIEILVSVLLFAFGLLGLVGLQARATQYSTDAEDRNRAALLADDLAAQMRLARAVSLSDAQLTAWKNRVQNPAVAGLPNADAAVTVSGGNTATIQITWKPPRAPATAASSQLSTQVVLTAEEIS